MNNHLVQLELQVIKETLKEQTVLTKEFLTLEDASIYLSLSKSTLYKMTASRRIPFYRPSGKVIYFRKAELDNWILTNRQNCIVEISNPSITNLKKH